MALYSIFHKSEVNRFLKANPQVTLEELESFYRNTQPVHSVRANQKFFIYETPSRGIFIFNSADVCWVHGENTKIKYYGVLPVGTIRKVALHTVSGEEAVVIGKSDKERGEIMAYLYSSLRNAVFGYSPEILRLWNEEVNQGTGHKTMVRLGQMQHMQQPVLK